MKMYDIIKKYSKLELIKIKDFLICEIDDDNDMIIDFLLSDDRIKSTRYSDLIYSDGEYEGVFLDGNQYIVSSDRKKVLVIDTLEKQYCKEAITSISFDLNEFIYLIQHKNEFLRFCDL